MFLAHLDEFENDFLRPRMTIPFLHRQVSSSPFLKGGYVELQTLSYEISSYCVKGADGAHFSAANAMRIYRID